VTSRIVEAFDGAERVACHPKIEVKGRYQTLPEHMPSAHRAQLADWTPKRFTDWAGQIGPHTVSAVEAIMGNAKIVEHSYRSLLGLLKLAEKQGGHTRLEDACAQALAVTVRPSYTLIKRLWTNWSPQPAQPASLGDAGFVRGADYYAQDGE